MTPNTHCAVFELPGVTGPVRWSPLGAYVHALVVTASKGPDDSFEVSKVVLDTVGDRGQCLVGTGPLQVAATATEGAAGTPDVGGEVVAVVLEAEDENL